MAIQALGAILQAIHAATLADMTGYASAQVGYITRVDSVGRSYVAVTTGTSTADGITYLTGTGVDWQMIYGSSDAKWLAQATWFIDPAGSNENSGIDLAHPIASITELQTRWGTDVVLPSTVVTLANGNYGTNQQTLRFGVKTNTDVVKIVGTPSSAIVSDTVGTFTAPSTVTNRMFLLTGAGITDWTPYVGKRVRFTVSGAVCFVLLVNPFGLGNGTAEITQPQLEPVSPSYTANPFTPTVGLAFVVEDLPIIGRLSLILEGAPTQVTDGTFKQIPSVVLASLNAQYLNAFTMSSEAPQLRVWGCSHLSIGVNSFVTNSVTFNTCYLNASNFYIPTAAYSGCGFKTPVAVVSQFNLTCNFWGSFNTCTFEGVGLTVGFGGAFLFQCGVFNSGSDGLTINAQAGNVVISGYCLGSGNVRGVSIGLGTALNKIGGYANMKLTGTGGDFRFGSGTIMAWATDAPRAQNQGAGVSTLVAGTVTVPVTALPSDARIVVNRNTPGGAVGEMSVPDASKTTSQFVINSASSTDTSTVNWHWFSPSGGNGGVFSA